MTMLNGIRVIDLGSFITAPLAAMMLGDLGADVIKIERPTGDPFRRSHGDDYGPTFCAYNRNKRSIVIDGTTSAGRAAQEKLLGTADILIDNLRPAALEKLGFSPSLLRAKYPKLIHCSITGFGTTGPNRGRPAFDSVGQALSGISSLFVDPNHPEAVGPTISDTATAMYAAYAIMGALFQRSQTGVGQRLELNMLEASIAFIQDRFLELTRTGMVSDRYTRPSRSQCFSLRCKDGKLISLHLSTTEKFWRSLIDALEAPHLLTDRRFLGHRDRAKNYSELRDELSKIFQARSLDAWSQRLSEADVPYAPIHSVDEVLADPQVSALRTAVTMHHPIQGEVVAIDCPILADGQRPNPTVRAPPLLGEHTQEILEELNPSVRSDGM